MSILIKSLTYRHANKDLLFNNLNLTVGQGEKAALVGNNGTGKSTLLQLIAGKLHPSAGELLTSEKPWYVPQHLGQYDELSIAQALGIDRKLRGFRAILNGETDPQHFTDLDDDWEIEEKLRSALAKWDLAHVSPDQRLGVLSGGQKTKVFLAGIALHDPEVLLLDEPSNHLDTDSRAHLYALIATSKATVLVVSHDRALLNLLPKTLELSKSGILVYVGNFDFYRGQKDEKLAALQGQLEEQSKTLKLSQQKARDMAEQRQKREARGRVQGQSQSLPRIIAGGLKSKAEQSTAKMQDVQSEKVVGITENIRQIRSQIQQHQVLKIDMGASTLHRGKILIDAVEIRFGYDGTPLWSPLTFQIRAGDRIRVEGANGAGKSTLLRILTGELKPTGGKILTAPFSSLYLNQDYTGIDPTRTVYEQVQQYNSRHLQEHELKSLLIYSQFQREMFDRKCAGLSGGEKVKLSLCCLAVSNHTPDLLILDEPTNNLDVQSLDVLTASVKGFTGTLLVVSHDSYFIQEIGVESRIWVGK
ncbi:ABC-F family ATP-binding cassette domain-containing protein [Larkinella insperata]|uniref:ABC-F family ATP-binding cassette domain-containing protein n=1 Tax=Larkinella insperata TaxID=332158 RepID=A0ABW3Q8H9_9BACT